jgi:hypothetical protein
MRPASKARPFFACRFRLVSRHCGYTVSDSLHIICVLGALSSGKIVISGIVNDSKSGGKGDSGECGGRDNVEKDLVVSRPPEEKRILSSFAMQGELVREHCPIERKYLP